MFETFRGLPLHMLVNHAAVVLTPLVALTSVVYALWPRVRWLLRWPVLVGSAVCLATAYVTVESGKALLAKTPDLRELVALHQELGERLLLILIGLFVVAVAAFFLLGGPNPVREKDRQGAAKPIQIAVAVLLVGVAVWALVQVVLTGEEGTRAVWGA